MYKKMLMCIIAFTMHSITHSDQLSDELVVLNNINILQNTDFWQRLRSGFRLDRKETDLVKYYEKRYTKNPKSFERIIANSKPYIYYVLLETERNGFPSEIALLPIVESSYNPFAVSPAAISTGMWQFVGMTGKRFNLAQTSQLDERQDVVKSSKAALKYLSYLNNMFGRWDLTLAAYNWGEGKIYRILQTAQKNGDSLSYNDLPFRDATKSYVPKLIALANIIDNPHKFGITLEPMPNDPYFAIVSSSDNLDTQKFTQLANISASNFKELNPQFKISNYSFINNQKLLIPVAKQNIYALNAGFISAPTVVANIESETIVASNNNVDDLIDNIMLDNESATTQSADIKQENIIINNHPQVINITTIAEKKFIPQKSKVVIIKKKKIITYKVKNGDTLYSISKKFNIDISDLKRSNKLMGNSIKLNQILQIKLN